MVNHELMVNGIKSVIDGLAILNYAAKCGKNGCEDCAAHMSNAIWINGERTQCIFRVLGLLKSEIDNCME